VVGGSQAFPRRPSSTFAYALFLGQGKNGIFRTGKGGRKPFLVLTKKGPRHFKRKKKVRGMGLFSPPVSEANLRGNRKKTGVDLQVFGKRKNDTKGSTPGAIGRLEIIYRGEGESRAGGGRGECYYKERKEKRPARRGKMFSVLRT